MLESNALALYRGQRVSEKIQVIDRRDLQCAFAGIVRCITGDRCVLRGVVEKGVLPLTYAVSCGMPTGRVFELELPRDYAGLLKALREMGMRSDNGEKPPSEEYANLQKGFYKFLKSKVPTSSKNDGTGYYLA